MAEIDSEAQELSGAYYVYALTVSIGLLAVLIYGGYSAWPILPTIVVGGVAQTAHRVIKRMWKNALTQGARENKGSTNEQDFRALLLVYVIMTAVSLLWYGVGWLAR